MIRKSLALLSSAKLKETYIPECPASKEATTQLQKQMHIVNTNTSSSASSGSVTMPETTHPEVSLPGLPSVTCKGHLALTLYDNSSLPTSTSPACFSSPALPASSWRTAVPSVVAVPSPRRRSGGLPAELSELLWRGRRMAVYEDRGMALWRVRAILREDPGYPRRMPRGECVSCGWGARGVVRGAWVGTWIWLMDWGWLRYAQRLSVMGTL